MSQQFSVYLRRPHLRDLPSLTEAYARSQELHRPWTCAPANMKDYILQPHRYLVCLATEESIVGTFNISEMVRGGFQSAYLGYEAFSPHNGRGYMFQGLQLLLAEAFDNLNLHRLEANIQPGNFASIALVKKAGFKKEGCSAAYLRMNGEWKDHERWAIINQKWVD